ncbi:hypothetical protein EV368DRAFT_66770 [Lentinula lateritia]|nr:hypothetical protein EV368DRAFT_66770 [Lentinula lateritia]
MCISYLPNPFLLFSMETRNRLIQKLALQHRRPGEGIGERLCGGGVGRLGERIGGTPGEDIRETPGGGIGGRPGGGIGGKPSGGIRGEPGKDRGGEDDLVKVSEDDLVDLVKVSEDGPDEVLLKSPELAISLTRQWSVVKDTCSWRKRSGELLVGGWKTRYTGRKEDAVREVDAESSQTSSKLYFKTSQQWVEDWTAPTTPSHRPSGAPCSVHRDHEILAALLEKDIQGIEVGMRNKVLREAEVVVQAASAQLGEQLNNVEQNIGALSIHHFNQFTETHQSSPPSTQTYSKKVPEIAHSSLHSPTPVSNRHRYHQSVPQDSGSSIPSNHVWNSLDEEAGYPEDSENSEDLGNDRWVPVSAMEVSSDEDKPLPGPEVLVWWKSKHEGHRNLVK